MGLRQPVSVDDVHRCTTEVINMLREGADRDWSLPAGTLEWSCHRTVEHMADCLFSYAGQVAVRPADHYVPFLVTADEGSSPAQMAEFVMAAGGVLAAVVDHASAGIRAYHPSGMADPEGFAAMGCVELLVHGHDVATGLRLDPDPPRDVCTRVLMRMFPQIDVDGDSWDLLLWATGRRELPGRGHPGAGWRWHGAPVDMLF
ncbi:hypothetical protein [Rhizohabitans arisaemae]|uniref:hypothetical protein n=1 Tax=Rhizohabitans arisaemae TaxID=2720610 RepID=UPI0024B1237B|nr:hypothetical protein [Rhizohabitans arisaemae]